MSEWLSEYLLNSFRKEIGIFDALQKGYLKAVQLAIYVDKEHPEIIVESYTFSFSYREKEDGTSAISLRVTDINGRGVTVEDANKNLQLMMRRLIVITQVRSLLQVLIYT
jgi:meiosis-specific protein HOP1